jgi:Ran GTPase-activating protein (RanGAP) involved in mRNA processing and transport
MIQIELSLNLDGFDLKNNGDSFIVNTLKTCEFRSISLDYTNLGDEEIQEFCEVFSFKNSLRHLSLGGNHFSIRGFEYISRLINKNILTELYLGNNRIDDVGVYLLSETLKKNRSIVDLNLSYNSFGSLGCRCLREALEINSTLMFLSLRKNRIGDIGIQFISKGLENNTSLTILDIHDCQISSLGMQHLSDLLKKNKSGLRAIALGMNSFGNIGAQHIGEFIKENHSINEIHLGGNEMTSVGLNCIADSLVFNNSLNVLTFLCGPVIDDLKCFVPSLQKNQSLQFIKAFFQIDVELEILLEKNKRETKCQLIRQHFGDLYIEKYVDSIIFFQK